MEASSRGQGKDGYSMIRKPLHMYLTMLFLNRPDVADVAILPFIIIIEDNDQQSDYRSSHDQQRICQLRVAMAKYALPCLTHSEASRSREDVLHVEAKVRKVRGCAKAAISPKNYGLKRFFSNKDTLLFL